MNLAVGIALLCVLPVWLLPGGWRKPLLILSTLIYWALMSAVAAAWMVGMSLLAWLASAERSRGAIPLSIAGLVAVLLTFKTVTAIYPSAGWVLPMGMSYYLFRCISYMLDVRWGAMKRLAFFDLLLYAAFFPAALAGPVDRSGTFTAQVHALRSRSWDHKEIRYGLFLILTGLLFKVILSARLEGLVHTLYGNPEACGVLAASVAVLAFPWQLYFDLGGYTLMALGMGRILGISLPPNFNRPFLAPTVSEFWNRWHMSLSGWFRDYVYTPIRFSLRRHRTASIWVASLGSFVLIGIWHGSGLGFVVFGLIQGLVVITETLMGWRGAPTLAAIVRTYLFVAFSLMLFEASDLTLASRVIPAFGRVHEGDLHRIFLAVGRLDICILLILVPVVEGITSLGWLDPRRGADLLDATPQPLRWLVYAVLVSSLLVLSVFEHMSFIYARF